MANKAISPVDFGGVFTSTGHAAPSAATDAATKAYVDALGKMRMPVATASDTQNTTSTTYIALPNMTLTVPTPPTGYTWDAVIVLLVRCQLAVSAGRPFVQLYKDAAIITDTERDATSSLVAGAFMNGTMGTTTGLVGGEVLSAKWKSSGGAGNTTINGRSFFVLLELTQNQS